MTVALVILLLAALCILVIAVYDAICTAIRKRKRRWPPKGGIFQDTKPEPPCPPSPGH